MSLSFQVSAHVTPLPLLQCGTEAHIIPYIFLAALLCAQYQKQLQYPADNPFFQRLVLYLQFYSSQQEAAYNLSLAARYRLLGTLRQS